MAMDNGTVFGNRRKRIFEDVIAFVDLAGFAAAYLWIAFPSFSLLIYSFDYQVMTGVWILSCILYVFAMLVLGGYTAVSPSKPSFGIRAAFGSWLFSFLMALAILMWIGHFDSAISILNGSLILVVWLIGYRVAGILVMARIGFMQWTASRIAVISSNAVDHSSIIQSLVGTGLDRVGGLGEAVIVDTIIIPETSLESTAGEKKKANSIIENGVRRLANKFCSAGRNRGDIPDAVLMIVTEDEIEKYHAQLGRVLALPVEVKKVAPSVLVTHGTGGWNLGKFAKLVLSNPRMKRGWKLKAVSDRLAAIVGLIVLAPLFAFIAIAIKIDSAGPVFFRQKRTGENDSTFWVWKFRTMTHKPEHERDEEFSQARRDDPRITKVGRFLRSRSLDEIPQLINVVLGEMSLVGPRPHAVEHNSKYRDRILDYSARHCVRPGITGWAQVNGWRGETSTIESMSRRVQHDLHYINNWSYVFDLRILILTLFVGFAHPRAY